MTSNSPILIIDDEPDIRSLLSITLERMGHNTHCAANFKDAQQQLNEKEFSLCLTDLKLPDGSGIDIVKFIQASKPQTPVIVITAHGSMDVAIDAMKQGAFDFINKPVDLAHLRNLITHALTLEKNQTPKADLSEIVGESPLIQTLKENIHKVARSQAPIFIHGESGSGKELVARAIHKAGSRHDKPFLAVNCGAIPKELMESEFFGHLKGSFTGAHQDKEGLFQSANGGTLFLDEVADLPMDMQVKLLRAIQEKSIRPVGGHKEIKIDVRILSATHKNLLDAIDNNLFRNDLYYRINVIEIKVPALRERAEDITLLCHTVLNRIAEKNATVAVQITDTAIEELKAYHFPGNVRELENILERACALCSENKIDQADLQLKQQNNISTSVDAEPSKDNRSGITTTNDHPLEHNFDARNTSLDDHLESIERNIILEYLEKNRWNRTTTAKVLGMSFRSLRYRLKKLGIDDE